MNTKNELYLITEANTTDEYITPIINTFALDLNLKLINTIIKLSEKIHKMKLELPMSYCSFITYSGIWLQQKTLENDIYISHDLPPLNNETEIEDITLINELLCIKPDHTFFFEITEKYSGTIFYSQIIPVKYLKNKSKLIKN